MPEHVEISIFFGAQPGAPESLALPVQKQHARSSVAPVQERHRKLPKIGFYKRYCCPWTKK
jgi:hypothetical protein